MSVYEYYALSDGLLAEMNLPALPFPVREERKAEVFGGRGVAFDLLLDELDAFLDENPRARVRYRVTVGLLAYVTGVRLGAEGYHEAAAHYLGMGVRAQPENVSLRSNYALALQALGRDEEARLHFEAVLCDPQVESNAAVKVMGARLHAAAGDAGRAAELLREVAADLPPEEAFWDFLAEMEARAPGKEKEEVFEAQLAPEPEPEPKRACGRCGRAWPAAIQFCGGCGASMETPSCPGCGAPMAGGLSFCTACGRGAPCRSCGEPAAPGVKFCRRCGTLLAERS